MGLRQVGLTMNKASVGDGIPAELFKTQRDDAVKVLHSICQQIWKTQQWPQDWKSSVFIPILRKDNGKECLNYYTIALILHTSNFRYADDTTLMAESEEKLKSFLITVKEVGEKDGLKLNIQKIKIMASGTITSWQIEGEKVEAVTDFIFLVSKISADND